LVGARTESHAHDRSGVPAQDEFLLSGVGIPDTHGTVIAPGDQPAAVVVEGNAADAAEVAGQRPDLPAGSGVPKDDAAVVGGRGDPPTVRAVGDTAAAAGLRHKHRDRTVLIMGS